MGALQCFVGIVSLLVFWGRWSRKRKKNGKHWDVCVVKTCACFMVYLCVFLLLHVWPFEILLNLF